MDGCSIDANGTPLTDETLAAAKNADAVLLGGPRWGTGAVRPEQGLLKLRREGVADLKGEHQLVGSVSIIMTRNPTCFDGVVVMSNLFGDIINDELGIMPTSTGLLPSFNLNRTPDGKGFHKPFGTILPVAMIFQYPFDLPEEAKAVEGPVRVALDGGLRATDLGGNTTREEVGDAVVKEMKKIIRA
ncbi:3-isopropylmalate dehydrogenase [Fusarium denticulatum]|uniref:3-isopropylmalate dehydrogenase n=1 Tax=Fusarium denticulatum TaxID=48507 RepID=A0A8H5U7F8_9HYPO|nr:3-isopropylmalate dehydrogenase [Fusarium denticulatum]